MTRRAKRIAQKSKFPDDAASEQIVSETDLVAGIKKGREQARRKEGIPAEEARKLIDSWV